MDVSIHLSCGRTQALVARRRPVLANRPGAVDAGASRRSARSALRRASNGPRVSIARGAPCIGMRARRNGPCPTTAVRSAADGRRIGLADPLLETIDGPEALRRLDEAELRALADEIRE